MYVNCYRVVQTWNFWETYQLPEVYQQLVAADNVLATVLKEHNDEAAVTETETVSADGTETTATETCYR